MTISIHAPYTGATKQPEWQEKLVIEFQSTHPCRMRPEFLNLSNSMGLN